MNVASSTLASIAEHEYAANVAINIIVWQCAEKNAAELLSPHDSISSLEKRMV